MSSEQERPSNETSESRGVIRCPDFTVMSTGVGLLPVPPGMAAMMHLLHHNGLSRGNKPGPARDGQSCRQQPLVDPTQPPDRAPPARRLEQRHHPPPQNRSPPPLPPPSAGYSDLIKQWERLLTWATLRTLTDFKVMPLRPAREASRRVAQRILTDYGPSLYNWLGRDTTKGTRTGG